MAPTVEVLPIPVSPGMTTWGRDDLPESAQGRAELRNKVNRARLERANKERESAQEAAELRNTVNRARVEPENKERRGLDVPTRTAPDERNEALGRAIRIQVAQGARVESQGDHQAIFVKRQLAHHIPNVVLVQESRMSVAVDEWGNTNVQELPWTRASRSGV